MGYKQYKQNSILTASKEKLLLMLYEHAIKSCKLAKKALLEGDIAGKCNHCAKAHDIIMELLTSLDVKSSGEVGPQLESLYAFCSSQLLKFNMENDVKVIDNVINVLTTLYQGWVEAVRELERGGGEGQNS